MTKFKGMTAVELKKLAKEAKVKNWWTLNKSELVSALSTIEETAVAVEPIETEPVEEPAEAIETINVTTLKEILSGTGIKGTKARRLLRNANIDRPFKRWEWDVNLHKDLIEQVYQVLGLTSQCL